MAEITDYSFARGLSDFGGAANALFGARGATAAAGSYREAAGIVNQNAILAATATQIRQTQEERRQYQVFGKQRAGVGGAGFAESGTAINLLRSSHQQGALTKALISNAGAITANTYAAQAGQYNAMADAAKASSTAQEIGGILQAAGGAYQIFNAGKGLFDLTNTATAETGAAAHGAEVAGAVELGEGVAGGAAAIGGYEAAGALVGSFGAAEGAAAVGTYVAAAEAAEWGWLAFALL